MNRKTKTFLIVTTLGVAGTAALFMLGDNAKGGKGDKKPNPKDPNAPPTDTSPELEGPVKYGKNFEGRLPPEFTEKSFWIAPNCDGYAIGREWTPISAGQTPESFYEAHGKTYPNDAEFPEDTIARLFVRDLLSTSRWAVNCDLDQIPMAPDAENYETFVALWEDWVAQYPAAAEMWATLLQEYVGPAMEDAWAVKFPEQLEERWALLAREGLDRGDFGDLNEAVDWAYLGAYPSCPVTINPSNPDHDDCKEAWIRMQALVAA